MELNSLSFLLFAAAVMLTYFAVGKIPKAQRLVLLAASVFMIVRTTWKKSLLIVVALTLVVFFIGIGIENAKKKSAQRAKTAGRGLLLAGVFSVLAVLCYFRVFTSVFLTVQELLAQRGILISELLMPIGLSYYALSMIGYLLDVYHAKHAAERSFLDFFCFVTYFPALLQGPINLYRELSPQLKESHAFSYDRGVGGLQRSLWGYFKKVVVADRIGVLVAGIMQDTEAVGVSVAWAMVLFVFQLYADFSGGIDVMLGVSEVLGIRLTENFRSPLVSQSITEFWKRWHISLGKFMEKYLYYPIVLNRRIIALSKKIPNTYLQKVFSATLASVAVFIVVGVWHGTGLTYFAYGCYHAFFVSMAVLLAPVYRAAKKALHIDGGSLSWRIFAALRTFLILTCGMILIYAQSLTQAGEIVKRIFSKWNPWVLFDESFLAYGLDDKNIYLMYICILIVIAVDIIESTGFRFREALMRRDIVFRYAVYFIGVFAVLVFGMYGPEITTTAFIYQGF